MEKGRKTHGLVIKLAESMEDFCDHWRPRRYIFGLSIGLEFCVVLKDAQSKPTESSVTTDRIPEVTRLTGAVARRPAAVLFDAPAGDRSTSGEEYAPTSLRCWILALTSSAGAS
jgi:hypothetical protein